MYVLDDTPAHLKGETKCETVAELNPETLLNALADTLPHVEAETQCDTYFMLWLIQ